MRRSFAGERTRHRKSAAGAAPLLVREGRLPPFLVGFEASGWAAVFGSLTCSVVATPAVLSYELTVGGWIEPIVGSYLTAASVRQPAFAAFGFGVALFALPQLLSAVLFGWLTYAAGFSVKFERRGAAVPNRSSERSSAG